jgi:hypothetical protein
LNSTRLFVPTPTVLPKSRPVEVNAKPLKPFETKLSARKVPAPVCWLMVCNAPRLGSWFPTAPYIVVNPDGVGDGAAVGVGVGVGGVPQYRPP